MASCSTGYGSTSVCNDDQYQDLWKGWRKSDSIDLYDSHFMTVDPEVHGSESTGVDNLDKVRILVISDIMTQNRQ